MTSAELAQILAGAALFLAAAALVLLLYLNRIVRALQRNQRIIFGNRGETDLLGHVADLDERVGNLRMAMEDLAVTAKDHEVRIDGCLARTGMVRFDAYDDLGGRQSTTVCFLDQNQNGVVLTTVVSREFARMYVKQIKDGQPDVQLAPEEIEAFDKARSTGPAPFTVRPRLDDLRGDRGMEYQPIESPEPKETEDDEAEQEAAARALERENRRRMRKGLPPLDALPPVPSTQGWGPPLAKQVVGLDPADGETDESLPAALSAVSPDQMRLGEEETAAAVRSAGAEAPGEPIAGSQGAHAQGTHARGNGPTSAGERTGDREPDGEHEHGVQTRGSTEDRDDDDTIDFQWETVPRPRRRRSSPGDHRDEGE